MNIMCRVEMRVVSLLLGGHQRELPHFVGPDLGHVEGGTIRADRNAVRIVETLKNTSKVTATSNLNRDSNLSDS